MVAAFLFCSDPAMAARVHGVDVSEWQLNMNWQTTYDAGIRFAFIRATRGGPAGGQYLDPKLDQNMSGAGAAGVLRGAYHYSRPGHIAKLNTTPGTGNNQPTNLEITTHALSEAQYFYSVAGQYMTEGYLRPVLDLEENSVKDQNNQNDPNFEPLTNTSLTLWANTFIDYIETLTGAEAIVYMNASFARDNVTTALNHRDLWLARYNIGHPGSIDLETSNPANPGTSWANPYGVWNDPIGGAPSHDAWTFWQYTNAGNGATYGASSTYIDLDLYQGSLTDLQQNFVIPEPATSALMGCIALITLHRRRRASL